MILIKKERNHCHCKDSKLYIRICTAQFCTAMTVMNPGPRQCVADHSPTCDFHPQPRSAESQFARHQTGAAQARPRLCSALAWLIPQPGCPGLSLQVVELRSMRMVKRNYLLNHTQLC